MKIKLTERQYKQLLREFTEVMVMCTPWKKCMDDPYGEKEETKWFVGRLQYNEDAEEWYPYSQDSGIYKTRDEATQAYFDGLYGKEPLMEMRFDGKSTGLFADEEPQEMNEFFGEKVKKYVGDKKEKFLDSLDKIIVVAKREKKETAEAAKRFKRLLTKNPPYVDNELLTAEEQIEEDKDFVGGQSLDLLKIIGVAGLGVVSSFIPIILEKLLKRYTDKSIFPKSQSEDPETGEDYPKEDIVNISIDTINGKRVVLATLGNEKVGALRLKPYKDSYQVDSVMVKPEYQGMGIGTEMYREANENHYPLYSDNNQTAESKSLWDKLIQSGEAKEEDGRYVMLPPKIEEGRKKKRGRPKAERSKKGRKVPGKYLTKNKSAMKKEIDTYAGKDTYKTKWDADYKSGKGGKGERYKTKESPATKAYRRMFGESNEIEEGKKGKSSTDDTLAKKAKASGISKTILKQVHSRGMAAWNSGHRPGTPQNAWAMGRVNSFITGSGGARKADADLWKKAKKSKARKKKSKKKKKNESVNYNRMVITENRTIVSEGLRYHLDNGIPLVENVYRYGSESYFNLINEVRELYNEGKVDLSFIDEELIKTDIGKKAIFEGKEVWLDIPMEDNEILAEAKFRGKTV
ncbi:MAG: GNAT family N-acetyltransferase, partial [Candidatus Dadabacteria bacterium]|nr:GNAT family N-acetyltransferase [Candidatus Dadabacteria bacterium]NIQ15860.1 GNAT family N-acetyltransferase [Candidatus Dadabacteria bacterium]